MVSITVSSFSKKSQVIELKDSIQITIQPVIGYSLLFSLFLFEAFFWGVCIFITHDNLFGIIGTIMVGVFVVYVLISEKKTITINPETRKLNVVTWSSQEMIKWNSNMKLSYVRMFNDSDELKGIDLYLSDPSGKENSILVFESEDSFREFANSFNKKYPNSPLL